MVTFPITSNSTRLSLNTDSRDPYNRHKNKEQLINTKTKRFFTRGEEEEKSLTIIILTHAWSWYHIQLINFCCPVGQTDTNNYNSYNKPKRLRKRNKKRFLQLIVQLQPHLANLCHLWFLTDSYLPKWNCSCKSYQHWNQKQHRDCYYYYYYYYYYYFWKITLLQ